MLQRILGFNSSMSATNTMGIVSPADCNGSAVSSRISPVRRGLVNTAARFRSPLSPADARLAERIGRILKDEPMVAWADGRSARELRYGSGNAVDEAKGDTKEIRAGSLTLPRLAAIHTLLSGENGPRNVVAVDNSPAIFAHTASVLMMLGSRVVVKEKDDYSMGQHMSSVLDSFGNEFVEGRIEYASKDDKDDVSKFADIAYGRGDAAIEHFGRDVKSGGYLVLQSEWHTDGELDYDPSVWQLIFSAMLDGEDGIGGQVMVTDQYTMDLSFEVFRRKA